MLRPSEKADSLDPCKSKSSFFFSNQSSDPIGAPGSNVNGPVKEVPFDADKHAKILRAGSHVFHIQTAEERIHLTNVDARIKGSGFGTAVMREMVKLSLKHGYQGNIKADATRSSHLFHLYMGMIPVDRKQNLIQYEWGMGGEKIIDRLEQGIYFEDKIKLRSDFDTLKSMLQYATKSNLNFSENDILKEENIKLISSLKNCSVSYVQALFIPMFLGFMENNCNKKYPDTGHWGSIAIKLSDEGKSRWKHAIDNETEFKPFRNFEHLHPFMSDEQKAKLVKLLEKRENFLKSLNEIKPQTNLKSEENAELKRTGITCAK